MKTSTLGFELTAFILIYYLNFPLCIPLFGILLNQINFTKQPLLIILAIVNPHPYLLLILSAVLTASPDNKLFLRAREYFMHSL